MIHLDAVSRRLGDFFVDSVDLLIDDGAYLVLLGPSGAGKSVLLNLLAGFDNPESGRILVDGADLTQQPPERRQVGLVQQQPALFAHYSVLGNLGFGLRARGVEAVERQRRIDSIVELLHLQPLVKRPVATLSGGEAQRVALARALVTRPRVLLLDEPLAPIDHNSRLELQTELRRVHDELSLTTVHVTHSRDEARALASHVAVMHAGRLIQSGPVDVVFDKPRCLFVARFLGVDEAKAPARTRCNGGCQAPGGSCSEPAA